MAAINPNFIEVKKVTELISKLPFMSAYFAHCGDDGVLYKATIDQLATFLAPYVASIGSVPYIPTSGTVLSNPTDKPSALTFVGSGTFTQTTGGNVVTTAPLNILSWNGITWSLTVAIPIDLTQYISKENARESFNNSGISFTNGTLKVLPKSTLYPNPTTWSIEVCMRLRSVSTAQNIFRNGANKPSLNINSNNIILTKDGVANVFSFSGTPYLNKVIFLTITYNGTNYVVKVNDVIIPVTPVAQTFTNALDDAFIGTFNGTIQPLNADIYLLRLFSNTLTPTETSLHYNNGAPMLFSVKKTSNLIMELLGTNFVNSRLPDSSLNNHSTELSGAYEGFSNYPILPNTLGSIKYNSGLKFTSGIVTINPDTSLFPNNTWTLEALIKPISVTAIQTVFRSGAGKPIMVFNSGNLQIAKEGSLTAIQFNVLNYVGKDIFVSVTFNGSDHVVYINGYSVPFTIVNPVTYLTDVSNAIVGSYSTGVQPFVGDISLIRVFSRVINQDEALNHYNNGLVLDVRVLKDASVTLELHGDNVNTQFWYDTSENVNNGIVSGNIDSRSISPTFNPDGSSSFLTAIPEEIFVAVGRQCNIYYKSLIPHYPHGVRVSITCPVGKSSERSYDYTPTSVESNSMSIVVKDMNGAVLDSKVITLTSVANNTGSGSPQILFGMGDSNEDSINPVDYPVIPPGRSRYETLNEISNLFISGGGANPLFLGNRGISPYKHEARSGWASSDFIGAASPYWDGIRLNFKNWMAVNSNFGGTDNINYFLIQIGINDLKNGADPSGLIANIKTFISALRNPTYGYPSVNVIISQCQYACGDRSGWALHFNATSDYETYIHNFIRANALIVSNFDNNVSYPNTSVCPSFLFVDRDYGYPHELKDASSRNTTDKVMEFTDSVHPNKSGYLQNADAQYSHLRALL